MRSTATSIWTSASVTRTAKASCASRRSANNVTDEAHGTQAIIDTGTQEFVFNPPRTYGLRMRVNF